MDSRDESRMSGKTFKVSCTLQCSEKHTNEDERSDNPKRIQEDFVEVDVDVIDIPPGRWRVVTSHVPERRFMIVKFATNEEISEARKLISNNEIDGSRKRRKEVDEQGFTYLWSSKEKVRPGLNVFDEKGNELEWDYEHDTRKRRRIAARLALCDDDEEEEEDEIWNKRTSSPTPQPWDRPKGRLANRVTRE
uniref:Uncharacterized protein n=1 Tax=Angiostrongylus cantonensis TaxID=6313 RepID=A0A0K0D1R3_ANGCA